MSDRQFERAVQDWLEDGSDRTPPAAVEAVRFAVKTTPQQRDLRVPRRFIHMTSYLRAAAAVAIVASFGVGVLAFISRTPGAGIDAATPTPSLTAPPSPAPTVGSSPSGTSVSFTSPLYRYTVTVPAGWVVRAATVPWPEGRTLTAEYGDAFEGPPASPDFDSVLVASQFVPEGMTTPDWLLRHAQQQAAADRDCKGAVEAWTDAGVGSLPIRRVDLECQGIRLSDVAFVVENRGYAMSGNREAIALFLNTFGHGEFLGGPSAAPRG